MGAYTKRAAEILAKAEIEINGMRPWDLQTKDPETLFRKVFDGGILAFSEAYMDREWDCENLFEFLCRAFRSNLENDIRSFGDFMLFLRARITNLQSERFARRNVEEHYDHGNDFYEPWLDRSMTYSSALWAGDVDDLDDAQIQKIHHIASKMKLERGMKVLDIGSGWGALGYVLATEYGVNVTGLTLSKEQLAMSQRRCEGVSAEFLFQDYRYHVGRYDRIVSVGMVEHVGSKNYPTYMDRAYRLLNSEGLFVCHGIVSPKPVTNRFIDKYIFPGGELGTTWQLAQAAEGAGFNVEDWENFGVGYERTLMAWRDNFIAHEEEIKRSIGPDILRKFGTMDRFLRAWRDLYLAGSAARFHVRRISVGQFVFSKDLVGRRYEGVRL